MKNERNQISPQDFWGYLSMHKVDYAFLRGVGRAYLSLRIVNLENALSKYKWGTKDQTSPFGTIVYWGTYSCLVGGILLLSQRNNGGESSINSHFSLIMTIALLSFCLFELWEQISDSKEAFAIRRFYKSPYYRINSLIITQYLEDFYS